MFYGLKTMQNLQRFKVGMKHHPDVQKRMGGIEAPRLRFHHMTYFKFTELLPYRTHSTRQVKTTVAEIAPDIYKYCCHKEGLIQCIIHNA